jgi:hypothetical protein
LLSNLLSKEPATEKNEPNTMQCSATAKGLPTSRTDADKNAQHQQRLGDDWNSDLADAAEDRAVDAEDRAVDAVDCGEPAKDEKGENDSDTDNTDANKNAHHQQQLGDDWNSDLADAA